MKFSEILQVIKPEYIYIKVKPNNSIKNNKTHLIARTLAGLHRSLLRSFKTEESKVIKLLGKDFIVGTKYRYEQQGKFSYYIYMEKEKIEFYFILPSHFFSIMKERLGDIWKGVTLQQVDSIPQFDETAQKYQMVYLKEDGLSLKTNRSDNDLLNSNLNIVEVLEAGDRVGIFYNFLPTSQVSFKHSYISTLEKVKKGAPTERNKLGASFALKFLISLIDTIINDVAEVLTGSKKGASGEERVLSGIAERLTGGNRVSESTERKGRGQVVSSQILVLSESPDRIRERNNRISLVQSFEAVSGDNRLSGKKFNGKINFLSKQLPGIESNIVSEDEVQSFISLAGRDLIERYSFMDKVETQETQLPKELQKGIMSIGTITYRGHKQKAFLSDDEQYKKLMLLLIGPTRAGKSNLIANLSIDAIEHGECVIIFDFIKKCELSSEVAACFPADKVLEITCDNPDTLQGLGYNEVGFSEVPFDQYENAKRQSSNTLALINSINVGSGDSSRLSPKMERYLESACLVVFVNSGSIKDVFSVLLNHKKRAEYISAVPPEMEYYLEEYLDSLEELDDKNKDGEVIGTRIQAGIIDRLNTLKRNTYMELMLRKGVEGNLDLVEEMQKNQLIVIKMPQAMFTTDAEKDTFTTYWMSKIWLALQVRADRFEDEKDLKKVNLVIDEIYQVNHTEQFLTAKLSQVAKFGMKPIVSCHYINQLKYIRDELRSANASYMLIAGCDKKNYDELRDELYPYTAEDLKNLKRYHSLNYIKTKGGYSSFITKLPPQVKTRI